MNNKKTNTSLSDTFDVHDEYVESECVEMIQLTSVPVDSDVSSDTNEVRNILYNLLKQGEDAFSHLKKFTIEEKSARSFEVLNAMLSNLSDIAVKLIDVHEKKIKMNKQLQNDSGNPVNNGTVTTNNNNIFVGTTSDLDDVVNRIKNNG